MSKDKQTVIYPEKESVINFHKQGNAFKASVVGFADFECFMERTLKEEAKQCTISICDKKWETCECKVSGSAELSRHQP